MSLTEGADSTEAQKQSLSDRGAGSPIEKSTSFPYFISSRPPQFETLEARTDAHIMSRTTVETTIQFGMVSPCRRSLVSRHLHASKTARHAAAYASFAFDNSLSLLTEDQSSILDNTLPSILEEVEIDVGIASGGESGFVGLGRATTKTTAFITSFNPITQALIGLGFEALGYPGDLQRPHTLPYTQPRD